MRISIPLLLLALTSSAIAQTTVYSNASPRANATVVAGSNVGAPTLVYWGGWATDGARMFNFGGRGVDAAGTALSTYYNALDAYDPVANTWTNLSAQGAATAPSNRFRTACVYDPSLNRLVVFGGSPSPGVPLDDCYAFDLNTNTWSAIPNPTPGVTGPTARWDATMQYDAAFGGLLLFGGQTVNSPATRSNETWILYGNTWTQLNPTTSPSARGLHAMTSRSAPYNDILLIGGQDAGGNLNDTWRWDGANLTWVQITPINNTVPVTWSSGEGAVYDSVRQVVTIIGGPGTGVAPSNSTSGNGWVSEYDCVTNEWRAYGNNTVSQNTSDPVWGQVQRKCMAFLNGKTYFWGGQNPPAIGDSTLAYVKEYQASPVATATSYGAGCTGPGGLLSLTTSELPWTGRTWTATSANLGPLSLGVELWGFASAALPLNAVLPISPVGCTLLDTAAIIRGPFVPAAGSVTTSLSIPNDPSLAGSQLYLQMAEMEFDAGFNWVGLYSSNGLALQVGAL
ncbi:MAG TPA: kelch repeat-containing protein [Planctomycetota bacterium]|nr:kelch repeat-containing protein [Planctomycetota bacterium]